MVTRTRLTTQMEERVHNGGRATPLYEGSDNVVSTGSTLLDLAISGGRFEYGGIPGGILVEIFGPSGCGKTVLLCELAGAVQRTGGDIMFRDPEGRLNKQFSSLFGFDIDEVDYSMPDTVKEVFEPVRKWKPKSDGLNGVFADSLAALSTQMEMDDADKYGMRRAKEFSEQLRMTCRILAQNNILMVCSNQIRQNLDAGPYGQKYKAPGGEAIGFYASLRLRCVSSEKIKKKIKEGSKEHSRIIGVESEFEVHKSSVWKPYRKAPVSILFDYGIDDIRTNLQFVKERRQLSSYCIGEERMGISLENAIVRVENAKLEAKLREEVVGLWREFDAKFSEERQPKRRL